MDTLVFRETAPDMDEKELLTHLLQFANVKDRDAMTTALLDRFGGLKAVLEARPEQLRTVDGIGAPVEVVLVECLCAKCSEFQACWTSVLEAECFDRD